MSVQVIGSGTIGGIDEGLSIVGIVTISAGTNNEGLRITGQHNNCVIFTSPSINGSAGYRLNHHPQTNFLRVDTTDQNGTFTGTVAKFSSAGLDMADNIKLRLGTNQDLTLYHYGNDAYIDNATGSILFRQGGSEKVRITSNGTIGINKTSPNSVLHVKHHNNDSADIRIEGGGSGNAGIQFIPGGQTNSYFAYVDTNRNFRIQDHASERLRIASDGDMGVGTNSPSARLHVNGGDGLLVERSGGTSVAGFKNTGASAMNIYFQNSGSTNHPYIGSSNQDLTLGTNNLERLRIDSSGRVLIGTTTEGNSSADDLTVAGSGESGITVRSGTSNGGHIYFSDATSGTAEYQGAVSYQHNGDFMKFNTGATERMRIQSNGYMALNTTGAQRLFSVKESNNKASILIWRTSESNADYSGIDFIGHPSNNGTNYQKGGIYWQTDGSGFGRGDMVFCNDGAADSDNVIISNEKLRIHKEGPVTKPNMPVASFSDSRAVDITNAILTSSNFYNHQWWNEGSHFNTSNGRFTCPVDGVYRIYFRATCDQSDHTNVRLRKNGSTINEAYANYSSGQTSSDSSEAIMHCSTNDYLEIQVSRLKTLGGTQHKQVTFQLLH